MISPDITSAVAQYVINQSLGTVTEPVMDHGYKLMLNT